MADRLFRDRRDAGRVLAGLLTHYAGQPGVLVLGLPRGGVPVAYEVAAALGAPLDIFVVRKLGVPGQEELAMGAVGSGGVVVLNDDVVRGFGIEPEVIQQAAEREGREVLRRERSYREGRPPPDPAGRTVILVDDGLATGASMQAAILALRERGPARIVVAVPAAPESTCRELQLEVDEVVCATTPSPFFAVGQSYWDFTQTTGEEVRDLLRAAAASTPVAASGRGGTEVIRSEALPVEDGVPSDEALFDLVGDAHLVLIGEASHGTHEFYAARARALSLLRPLQRRRRAVVRLRGSLRGRGDVRAAGGRAARRPAPLGGRVRPAGRARRRGRGLPRRAEREDRGGRGAVLPRHVQRPGLVLEPARPAHGRDAGSAQRPPRPAAGHPGEGRRVGAQLAPRRRPDDRDGMRGELNVGQLVRERHPGDCRLVGFTTYTGTVTAADDWGAPAERKLVRPALADSVEELFHEGGEKGFLVSFGAPPGSAETLRSARLERAIGVIYRPDTERQSHYFRSRVADQFDAVIHVDETRAVEPLERTARWEEGEVPETYPFAV